MQTLVINRELKRAYRIVGDNYIQIPWHHALFLISVGAAIEVQEA